MHREHPPWVEFRDLIAGLLQTRSRLWHAVTPTQSNDEPPESGVTSEW